MKSLIQKSTQLILSLILTSACIPPLDKSPLDLALFAGMSLFSKTSIITVSIETLEGENFQIKLEGGLSDNLLEIPTNGTYS